MTFFCVCGASSANLPKSSLASVFWPLKVRINLHTLLFYEILNKRFNSGNKSWYKKDRPIFFIRLTHKYRHKKTCVGVQEGGLSRRPLPLWAEAILALTVIALFTFPYTVQLPASRDSGCPKKKYGGRKNSEPLERHVKVITQRTRFAAGVIRKKPHLFSLDWVHHRVNQTDDTEKGGK